MGREVGRSSMRKLYEEDLKPDCSGSHIDIKLLANRPFFLADLIADDEEFKNEALGHVGSYTNIVLVGHSLGGHTAYKIAQLLLSERPENAVSVLLVTLDPTSMSWGGRTTIAPSRWHNMGQSGSTGSAKKCGAIRQHAVQLQPICRRSSVPDTTAQISPARCRQGLALGPAV